MKGTVTSPANLTILRGSDGGVGGDGCSQGIVLGFKLICERLELDGVNACGGDAVGDTVDQRNRGVNGVGVRFNLSGEVIDFNRHRF